MSSLLPKNEKLEKIFLYVNPILTYLVAAMAATWWIDDDLLRGIVFLVGIYVFTYESGVKNFYKPNKNHLYFYLVYVVPVGLATIFFIYGFFKSST